MAEQSNSQRLQANERIKHAASAVTAWANALIIAAFARAGIKGDLDAYSIVWLIAALVLILASSHGLTMLREKDEI